MGVRLKVKRVRVRMMYFIRSFILGGFKESNTSDPGQDSGNEDVRSSIFGVGGVGRQ
jgi:hypothetical protein